jgi:hypothetical protein
MSKPRYILAIAGAAIVAAASMAAPQAQGYRGGARLRGTYQLDRSRSDNPQRIADQAVRSLPPDQHDRVYQNLVTRLDAPDSIAIDIDGRSVTIMSSTGPRITFQADGRNRTESGPNGRVQTTRADLQGDGIVVSTTGSRGSDFTVQFDPTPDGLRVTRQLDSDMLQGSVASQSTYRRVAPEPRWTLYNDRGPGAYGPPPPPPPARGEVFVPEGTRLDARLDNYLSSRSAHEGDRFSMTVVTNGPFRDARLDGIVDRAVNGAGRASMMFDFDRIRMTNGQSGPLEAVIESARTPQGQELRIDRSGGVRDNSTGGANAGDTAVGATLGAIIGAIAGGGKGAAVGAVAGGAGTILIEGQSELNLPAGSIITLTIVRPR